MSSSLYKRLSRAIFETDFESYVKLAYELPAATDLDARTHVTLWPTLEATKSRRGYPPLAFSEEFVRAACCALDARIRVLRDGWKHHIVMLPGAAHEARRLPVLVVPVWAALPGMTVARLKKLKHDEVGQRALTALHAITGETPWKESNGC